MLEGLHVFRLAFPAVLHLVFGRFARWLGTLFELGGMVLLSLSYVLCLFFIHHLADGRAFVFVAIPTVHNVFEILMDVLM